MKDGIDRIYLFKLVDPETRPRVLALLRGTLGQLPTLADFRLGTAADPASAKSWDLSCVLTFASLEEHDGALASDALRELPAALGPSVVVSKAWSFQRSAL